MKKYLVLFSAILFLASAIFGPILGYAGAENIAGFIVFCFLMFSWSIEENDNVHISDLTFKKLRWFYALIAVLVVAIFVYSGWFASAIFTMFSLYICSNALKEGK